MQKPVKEEIVYNNRLVVEEATFSDKNGEFKRQRLNREDAAVILVINKESNKVVLTKQFRYAISTKTNDRILEIVAGKLDKDEDPLEAAIREVEEEVGYKVKPENIWYIFSSFVSPGYSSERFFFYYATVMNLDKVSKGGGVESEHEEIEVVEIDVEEFIQMVKEGDIQDSKTYIAGMYLVQTLEHHT